MHSWVQGNLNEGEGNKVPPARMPKDEGEGLVFYTHPLNAMGAPARRADMVNALSLSARQVCRVVADLVDEMLNLTAGREKRGPERRRLACHSRQIAIYVCHVTLSIGQPQIALGFGCHRSTVGHACASVEDRRDNRNYDFFVGAVERAVRAVFLVPEGGYHDKA